MFTWILNAGIDLIVGIVSLVIFLLPDSPFQDITFEGAGPLSSVLGFINYFIPVTGMLAILSIYISAVAVYYTVRWVLKTIKYI